MTDETKSPEASGSNFQTATQAKPSGPAQNVPQQPGNNNTAGSTAKFQALIGIVAITLANVAGFISNVDKIREFVLKILGTEWAYHFHTLIVYCGSALLLIGYGALTYWIYWNFVVRRTLLIKVGFYVAAFVAVGTMVFGSYEFLFKPVDFVSLIKKQTSEYVQTILSQQTGSGEYTGGFRFSQGEMSNDTQAWTTAQCLVGLLQQNSTALNDTTRAQIRKAFEFIEHMRLKSPDNGWGYQAGFNWGVTEIDAWVALAYIYSLRGNNAATIWSPNEIPDALAKTNSILEILLNRQHGDGSWGPIEKTDNPKHARTYSAIMATWALAQAEQNSDVLRGHEADYQAAVTLAAKWLLSSYTKNPEGFSGWWPNPSAKNPAESYPGLEAQGLFVLSVAKASHPFIGSDPKYQDAVGTFVKLGLDGNNTLEPLVKRKITYNEKAHDSDRYLEGRTETAEQSTFLWYPWSIALAATLEHDSNLADFQRERMEKLLSSLFERADEEGTFVRNDPVIYPTAEILFADGYYFSRDGLTAKQK
jgi:hypothetical protein